MKAVVVIDIMGGTASVSYASGGIRVLVRDFDVECDGTGEGGGPAHCKDTDGSDFHLFIHEGPIGNAGVKKNAIRFIQMKGR